MLTNAETPIRFLFGKRVRESSVETMFSLPDKLECTLDDLMPHLSKVTYSINFSEYMAVKDISRDGKFTISQFKDENGNYSPWLIEGVNTLTIVSENRVNMLNRQTSVIQVFTTPARLEILWPPIDGIIRDPHTNLRLVGRVSYEAGLESIDKSNIALTINGIVNSITTELTDWNALNETDSGYIISTESAAKSYDIRVLPSWKAVSFSDATRKIAVSAKSTTTGNKNGHTSNAFWQFTIDTTPPLIKIHAPEAVPIRDSTIKFCLELSDDHSPEIKDIRIRLYKRKGESWEHIESHNRFFESLPVGRHFDSEPLTKDKSSLFSKALSIFTGNMLDEGNYMLEIRGRDCALIDREHFLKERRLRDFYAERNEESIKKLYTEYYDKKYVFDAINRFNWSADSFCFIIDNTPPKIEYNRFLPYEISSSGPLKTMQFEWKFSEPCTVRWAIDKIITIKDKGNFFQEAMRGELFSSEKGELSLDFSNNKRPLTDGTYRMRLLAIDRAGYTSDTSNSKEFIIDQTPPVISEMAIPKLVAPNGDTEISLPLRFTAMDIFSIDTFEISRNNVMLIVSKPDGSDSLIDPSKCGLIKSTTKPFSWEIPSLGTNIFNRGNGKYSLKLEIKDNRVNPNKTQRFETVVKGCLPPRITSPLPFSELSSTFAIKGTAKDPNWMDSVPFSHYNIEYRKEGTSDWRTAGVSLVSERVSVENGLLAFFDPQSANLDEGYYDLRLTAFDGHYREELGSSPLSQPENIDTWAADTIRFFYYKESSLLNNSSVSMTIIPPEDNPIRFNGRDQKKFSVRISGSGTKLYDTKLSLFSPSGELVADTIFRDVLADSSGSGEPSTFNRLGLFIYKKGERWYIKWNSAGSGTRFDCFVRFCGIAKDFSDPLKCADFSFSENGSTNSIYFTDSTKGEISFVSEASSLDIKTESIPYRTAPWVFLGAKPLSRGGGLFTVGAVSERSFYWSGYNRFGFFPQPGKYKIVATAYGINGIGRASASKEVNSSFPYGVRIEGLSDTLFEMDTTTFYRELTLRYRPFGSGYLSCYLIDKASNSTPLFIDTLVYGRSDSAPACTYTWNFNIHENQLIPEGRYKLVLRLKPDANNNSAYATDTSKPFTFKVITVINDPLIAALSVQGDTTIDYQGRKAAVVSGKSGLRWMAFGTGVSYPDIPFTYTYKPSGKQLVYPHRFQRFTVKARRGFKRLNYKVRMYLEAQYYPRSWTGARLFKEQSSYKQRFITNTNTGHFDFSDSIKGINKHPLSFTASTDWPYLRQRAFVGSNGLPILHVYFLKNSYNGPENPDGWANAAIETISIPSDMEFNGTTECYALNKEVFYRNRMDQSGDYISKEEYENIIEKKPELATDYEKIEGTQFGQFRVILKRQSRSPDDKARFFQYQVSIEVGVRPEIWDPNYTQHGYNNIVNRYTTWDSENPIFYDKGKGIISKDGLDNDLINRIDDKNEELKKYVSDQHVQIFDFKFLQNEKGKYRPLYFDGLEKQTEKSVEMPFWEFRLACRPDAGTYKQFGWSSCFSPGKLPDAAENYTMRITEQDAMQSKIRIEGDEGPRALMVYCLEPDAIGKSAMHIDWPITVNGLDSLNLTSPALLAQKLPGSDTSLKFIPPFNGNVRYGPGDGLDQNKDGKIDYLWYNPPPESITALSKRISVNDKTEYKGSGRVTLLANGEYKFPVINSGNIEKYGANVIPSIKITSIQSSIPLTAKELLDGGSAVINFVPLNGPPPWSTDEDPALQNSGEDILDSLDNNGNLVIDENSRGYIMSDPVPFAPHGFAFSQEYNISDAYPKFALSNDSRALYCFDKQKGVLYDNPATSAENWRIDIRHINGEPNREFEIQEVTAGGTGLNDLHDRFTIKLKDNVFNPKRVVEVRGRAVGEYRLLVRNGSGWKQISPVITHKETNNSATFDRTIAYWDIGGLCGGNTLLLQVRRDGKVYQAMQTLFAGQFAGKSDQSLYSTYSRSRVDIAGSSLAAWGDTAFVSATPRKLNELALTSQPKMNPVGPIMELRPSPASFTPENRPKLTINFTFNEAKSNGWLDANLNLYNIKADGTIDIIENSITSYFKTDRNGIPQEKLAGKEAFVVHGEETNGLGLMTITAETDHWSTFSIFKRPTRTFYVNGAVLVSGGGKSWIDAFKTADEAYSAALSGDTIKIAFGTYTFKPLAGKNIIVQGGWKPSDKSPVPALNQTIFLNHVKLEGSQHISGIVFDSGCGIKDNSTTFYRCAIKNLIKLNNSTISLINVTIASAKIQTDTLSSINALNTVFSAVSGWKKTIKGDGNSSFNGPLCEPSISNLNPSISNRFLLNRNSPIIDKGINKREEAFAGIGIDPGFHEFVGDTLFLCAKAGSDVNGGRSAEQPLKSIKAAIRKSASHDIILIANGNYSSLDTIAFPLTLIGGYNSNFKNRNPFPAKSFISGTLLFNNGGRLSNMSIQGEHSRISVVNSNSQFDSCSFIGSNEALRLHGGRHHINNCLFSNNNTSIICSGSANLSIQKATFATNMSGVKSVNSGLISVKNSIFLNTKMSILPTDTNIIAISHTVNWPKSIPHTKYNGILSFNPMLANPDSSDFRPLPHSPCIYSSDKHSLIGAFAPYRSIVGVYSDTSAAIRINNIYRRWLNHTVKPEVEFKNRQITDSTVALINNKPFKKGMEIFAEGRHTLYAAIIRRGTVITDTTLNFVIDYTPPEISISNIPPLYTKGWKKGHDNVWEIEGPITAAKVLINEPYLKEQLVSLNGRSYKKEFITLQNGGEYVITVSATDSALNNSSEKYVFRIVPNGNLFRLVLTSPTQLDSTNNPSVELSGFVNSPNASLTVNDERLDGSTRFDSTFFFCVKPLALGVNTFNIKALSSSSGASDFKKVVVTRDTAKPIITMISPLNGSIITNDSGTKFIPIEGTIESRASIKSLVVRTPLDNKSIAVTKIGQLHSFVGTIFIQGEWEQFPLQIIALNRFGVSDTLNISIKIGIPPRLTETSPANGSYTSQQTPILSGKVIDSKTKRISIQNEPISFTQSGDTAYYSLPISLQLNSTTVLKIVAEDSTGLTDTKFLTINHDDIAPVISITSPTDNFITTANSVNIAGIVDDQNTTIICGSDTLYPPHGTTFIFSNYLLISGINTITVTAKDAAINWATPSTVRISKIDASVLFVDKNATDGGNGSSLSPFKTVTEAIAASTVNSTIIIRPGEYNESVSFKSGQRIQSETGGVTLSCGATPFTIVGSLHIEGVKLTGNGQILEARNGQILSMVRCTLFINNNGANISAFDNVILKELKISQGTLASLDAGYSIALSACNSVSISDCHLDSSGNVGINIGNTVEFTISNVLFNGFSSEGLQITNSNGTVKYCTFVNNLAAINIVGGSLILLNSIIANSASYAIQKMSADIQASYSLYFNNVLGWAESVEGLDSSTTLFVNPLFRPLGNYDLFPESPAKTASSVGGEIGWTGRQFMGKNNIKSILITSPTSGTTINKVINIRLSASRSESDLSALEISNYTDKIDITPAKPNDNEYIWGKINPALLENGSILDIRYKSATARVRIGSPVVELEGDSATIYSRFKLTSEKQNNSFHYANGWLFCLNDFKDTVFQLATTPIVSVSDSFFINKGVSSFRLWRYIFETGNKNNKQQNLTNDIPLKITELHMVPSPYRIGIKRNGFIRYRLSTDCNVDLIIFDRSGNAVKQWGFVAGLNGGRAGVNEIAWDGRNRNGTDCVSGVYIAQISRKGSGVKAKVRFAVSSAK